jgi:ketosteroid isomerase-like protein
VLPPDLAQVIDQYHQAVDAFVRGDTEPEARLFSRRDDVTLAHPLGPPARGWPQVEQALQHAAVQIRDGEPCRFEQITAVVTADLAYTVELQRTRARFGGADDLMPSSLRVTTIFRREDGEWRVVHRHADPITAPQSIASVVER